MEGGRLISEGRYGCIFDPPLLCEDSRARRRADIRRGQMLGKLTERRDYIVEEAASEHIRAIPNFEEYFIPIELNSDCVPKPIEQQKDTDVWKCYFLQEQGFDMSRTVYYKLKYGGVDVSDMLCIEKQGRSCEIKAVFQKWYPYFEHMLEIGATMVLYGFVHYDIHNSNIVVDPKTKLPRLIDFGQAFSADSITKKTLDDRWKQITPDKPVSATEPPEVMMITHLKKEFTATQAFSQVIRFKAPIARAELLLGLSRQKQGQSFIDFWRNSGIVQRKDWVEFFKLYWPGFDAWSIGAALLHLYEYCSGLSEIADTKEFQEASPRMKTVLRALLQVNPKRRFDCLEALNLWNPENRIVISERGQQWLEAREKQREAM